MLQDSVGDNGFIENTSGLSSGENVVQFCEQVGSLKKIEQHKFIYLSCHKIYLFILSYLTFVLRICGV